MIVDKEKVLQTVDEWAYDKYGSHILTEEGKVNVDSVMELVNGKGGENTEIVSSDQEVIVDVLDEPDGEYLGEEFWINFDNNELILYVPKELREKIQFEIQYVLSGFDKIQTAIADLSREFQIDRKGAIVNAEKEIYNCGDKFSQDSRQILIGCINDVGNSIEQIKGSIVGLCDEIARIPQNRKRRIFKTPIETTLKKVEYGKMSVLDYVYGTAVYAELNLKLGRKQAAVSRMQESIDFLSKMRTEKFARVEQWNRGKDGFWEDGKEGVDYQIELLKRQLLEVQNYSGKITD